MRDNQIIRVRAPMATETNVSRPPPALLAESAAVRARTLHLPRPHRHRHRPPRPRCQPPRRHCGPRLLTPCVHMSRGVRVRRARSRTHVREPWTVRRMRASARRGASAPSSPLWVGGAAAMRQQHSSAARALAHHHRSSSSSSSSRSSSSSTSRTSITTTRQTDN